MIIALDINGVLCKRHYQPINPIPHGIICGNHVIQLRPHLQTFLNYCFTNHTVGVFSCITNRNIIANIKHIFTKEQLEKLAFIIDRSSMGDDKKFKSIDRIKEIFPDRNDILIIDDTLSKVQKNPSGTYIIIPPFDPDINSDDNVLLDLCKNIQNL